MSESTPDELRDQIAHLVHETESMPAGQAKCEALERAVRSADAAGFTDYAVVARLLLVNAYREIRRYDLMLTPFAWLRATERKHPESFDEWALHQFNWMHKWLPTGLLGDPRFTLDQITSVVGELADRYRQQGFSLHPVYDKQRAVAHHIGDNETADAHFAQWRAAEPDEMSDCAACVVDSQVGYFVSRSRYEEAIDAARSVLTEPSDCAEQPHGVMASLLDAYLATGRLEDAARAHLLSYRVVRDTPQARSALHAHLRFCAVTGNLDRGLEIMSRNLDVLTDPPSPKVRQDFAASAALLLSRVPDRHKRTFLVDGGLRDGDELRTLCEDTARSIALEFDQRNGTDAVSKRVEETLALPDVGPVVLAVPATVPTAEPVPETPADPVDSIEIATRGCAELDYGNTFAGARLLARLPASVEAILPRPLEARVRLHRSKLIRWADPDAAINELTVVSRLFLLDADHAFIGRTHLAMAEIYFDAERFSDASDNGAIALTTAIQRDDVIGEINTHLFAAVLLAGVDGDRSHTILDDAEELAVAFHPARLGSIRRVRAQLRQREGDLDGALAIIEDLTATADQWPEATRLAVSGHRARLLAKVGRIDDAVIQFADYVAYARTYPGPWVAEALMQWASLLDQSGLSGSHLPILIDNVAAARRHLPQASVAQACLHLSAGYLAVGRDIEAAETLEEVLRLMPESHTNPLAETHYRLAVACRNLEEWQSAAEHFQSVLTVAAEDEDSALHAHVHFQLGDAQLELLDLDEAAASFAASSARWLEAGNSVSAAEALVRLAHATGLEDLDAGLAALDQAAALLPDETLLGALDQLADIIGFRVALLAHHERFAEALQVNQRTEEYAVRLGNSEWHAFLAGRAARLRLDLGQLPQAETDARRAAALLTDDAGEATIGAVLGTLMRALEEQGKAIDTDPVVRSLTARLDT